MKQYIEKDACYGVKVYVSELKNLTSHERLLWGTRDERNGWRDIRSQSGRDTGTCTQAWDSRSSFTLFSSFMTVAERQRGFECSQKYFNRQSDTRSPDKAGIKPFEKLSSAFVCESTHLKMGHHMQSERVWDIMSGHYDGTPKESLGTAERELKLALWHHNHLKLKEQL